MSGGLVTAAYIVAAILFIFSLAGLSKHETSQQGNRFGIAGMAIALIATIFGPETGNVVWNVSHALHTPLMSVTNAISGIIVVGALLQIGHGGWVSFLSFIAVLIASINIFGGFTVTQRMLKMFRKN